jgi:hypothetical protein
MNYVTNKVVGATLFDLFESEKLNGQLIPNMAPWTPTNI